MRKVLFAVAIITASLLGGIAYAALVLFLVK